MSWDYLADIANETAAAVYGSDAILRRGLQEWPTQAILYGMDEQTLEGDAPGAIVRRPYIDLHAHSVPEPLVGDTVAIGAVTWHIYEVIGHFDRMWRCKVRAA